MDKNLTGVPKDSPGLNRIKFHFQLAVIFLLILILPLKLMLFKVASPAGFVVLIYVVLSLRE